MKKILFLNVFVIVTVCSYAYNGDEGKTIFTTRCTACHAIDKNIVGPALMNVDARHDEKWIIAFVHSSQTVIKSGDTAAVNLFRKFNSTVMPDHPDLTDEQVKSIISYIKTESLKEASLPKTTMRRPMEFKPPYTPVKFTDYIFWFTFLSSVALLVWSLLMRVDVESMK